MPVERPDLHCLLLGLSAASPGPEENRWLSRRIHLMLQQRRISSSVPRKLTHPIKTTTSAEGEVAEAHFILADLSLPDPVLFFYLGLARSLGKPLISLCRFDSRVARPVHRLADFAIDYEDSGPGQEELAKKLNGALDALERSTELDRSVLLGQGVAALDWTRLNAVHHENLCFEILLREGYRDLEWLAGTREVSLTALRVPKEGPPQLHLISIGSGLSDRFALEGWSTDLPALTARVNALEARHRLIDAEGKLGLHVLFIWSPREGSDDVTAVDSGLLRELGRRLAGLAEGLGAQVSLHLQTWHRHRLEGLIARWPMLQRHYFARDLAAEPLDRRKTAEDLFWEAARLGQRAAEASGLLEQKYGLDPGFEWQRRAYTVTHSIGNAIFPVETYLDFLEERLRSAGDAEGEELARRSMESIEKAKVHIFKFKNIARFKKPQLQAIDIVPRLNMSLAAAAHRGIRVERYIGEHPKVDADPDLFDELIDELVANSITWLGDAEEQRLEVIIKPAGADDLTPRLTGSERDFLWLRFADSGPGVRHELKEKIFDLFFSTNPQGMGFGLAIVRKNLRDFGGDIVETGMPGQGICYDILLPISV